ncbi:Uncharacterised protein [uncultured archaeon]|nr:Uncharacterised protein [uncultured archaeon]
MDKQGWEEILKELNALCELHEQGVAQPSKCREFGHRASLFLDRLEGLGAYEVADRIMELLGGCSPKDFSPCDNRQRTKGSLERLRDRVRERLENG